MLEEGMGWIFYGSPSIGCLGKTGSSKVGIEDRVFVWETEEVPLEMDEGDN